MAAVLDAKRPRPNLALPLNPQRAAVVRWAQQMIDEGCLILDTETIGLPRSQGGNGAEPCQIGLVRLDKNGVYIRMDQLINPGRDDWSEKAMEIHGITPAMVKDRPTLVEVWTTILWEVSQVDHLVIFNRAFDIRALRDGLGAAGIKLACPPSGSRPDCLVFPTGAGVHCAMVKYSDWVQEPKRGKPDWKWQKLPSYGHSAHSAVGDCLSTADLIKDLAGVQVP